MVVALNLKGYVEPSPAEDIVVDEAAVEPVVGGEVLLAAAVERQHRKVLDQSVEDNPVKLPVGDTVVLKCSIPCHVISEV